MLAKRLPVIDLREFWILRYLLTLLLNTANSELYYYSHRIGLQSRKISDLRYNLKKFAVSTFFLLFEWYIGLKVEYSNLVQTGRQHYNVYFNITYSFFC